jgi:hypothetical protein
VCEILVSRKKMRKERRSIPVEIMVWKRMLLATRKTDSFGISSRTARRRGQQFGVCVCVELG